MSPVLVARGAVVALLALVFWCLPARTSAQETMRLEWIVQGQFAGELVAYDKGYYRALGVDLKLLPAGSDIKPAITVAQGSDTFGIGHPNQVIMARSHGAPLVMVAQFGQKSAQVYIGRKDAGIFSLKDVVGKRVGLWYGGDEAEFFAMLHAAGIDPASVHMMSQPDNPIPEFLEKRFDVIESTRYAPGDMKPLYAAYRKDQLTFINPEDYHAAMINTGLFTTQRTIDQNPKLVQAVVDATLRGWQEAFRDPRAAAAIVIKYNPELNLDDQIAMIGGMQDLFCTGPTLHGEFGKSEPAAWANVQRILLGDGTRDPNGLQQPVDLHAAYTNAFWERAPAAYKTIRCTR
jgi:NitT/TauT family transport system substrate-binding protein